MTNNERIEEIENMVRDVKRYVNAFSTEMIVSDLEKIEDKLFWLKQNIK